MSSKCHGYPSIDFLLQFWNTPPAMKKKHASNHIHPHADHSKNVKSLNRVIGQLEGVRKMIDERRYCADILIQTRAAAAALKKIELTILKSHMNHCVSEAFREKAPERAAGKIDELVKIMERF